MLRIYGAINEPSRIHGERIRKTRRGLGMTQAELAKMFGVWRETINRIENGHFDITRAYPRYQNPQRAHEDLGGNEQRGEKEEV